MIGLINPSSSDHSTARRHKAAESSWLERAILTGVWTIALSLTAAAHHGGHHCVLPWNPA